MQSRQTKQEIADENEGYRSTLEQAALLLLGALGYAGEGEDEDEDEDEESEDEESEDDE